MASQRDWSEAAGGGLNACALGHTGRSADDQRECRRSFFFSLRFVSTSAAVALDAPKLMQ
jgi:hypothetical protein